MPEPVYNGWVYFFVYSSCAIMGMHRKGGGLVSAHLLSIRLYQILEEHSDHAHPLSMGELRRLLRLEYGLTCDRRTVYRALDTLRQAGIDIPEFQDSGAGYYLLSRRLEPSEVRLLLDCAAAFPGMGERQYRDLKETLLRGLSRFQRQSCRPLSLPTVYRGVNREVLLAVEVLGEAIAAGRQVSFQYMKYKMDKKLHPRRERPYQVHPYGLCFANGNYYLICRYPGYDTLSHYRVDRIQNPVLTQEPREPLPQGLDLSRYVRERVYQISGKSVQAVLRCENSLLSDVLDRFGLDTMLHDNGNGTFDAVVTGEPEGLKFWAVQYLERCEIRTPQRLRQELAETLREGWELYCAPLASVDDHQTIEEETQDE